MIFLYNKIQTYDNPLPQFSYLDTVMGLEGYKMPSMSLKSNIRAIKL